MSDEGDEAAAFAEFERERGVRRARQQLHGHSTGTCIDCETEIPAARRKALPQAQRCVRCQTVHETER